jgi:hypothetical protein
MLFHHANLGVKRRSARTTSARRDDGNRDTAEPRVRHKEPGPDPGRHAATRQKREPLPFIVDAPGKTGPLSASDLDSSRGCWEEQSGARTFMVIAPSLEYASQTRP